MTTIIVQAAPGLRVPLEGAPRRYITDATPVTVPDSAYYRRRLADGDLLQVPDAAPAEEMTNGQ